MNPERRSWQSATTDGRRLRRHRLLRLAHGCARYHDTTDDPGGDQPRSLNPDRQELCSHNDPTTTHFLDIFTFSPLDHEWSDLAPGLDEQLSCILSSRRISSHDTHHFAPACGGHCLGISFFLVLNNNHIHIFFSSGFNGGGYLLVSATAILTYACEPRREKLGYRCLVNFEENHGPGCYVACLMRLRLVLFC